MQTAEEAYRLVYNALAPIALEERERGFLSLDLVGGLLGIPRSDWPLRRTERILSEEEIGQIGNGVERLLHHEPLQYILGVAPFGPLMLQVAPGVLIPRPETEELCERITRAWSAKPSPTFLDVGAGSGAITLYLCNALTGSRGFALENSPRALVVLQQNIVQQLSAIAPSAITLLPFDLLSPEDFTLSLPPLDLLVSNPPYVMSFEKSEMAPHVCCSEPSEALFAPDGKPLFFYEAIIRLVADLSFNPGARLYLEINAALGEETAALFRASPHFDGVSVAKDLFGRNRFVEAVIRKNR